MYIYIIFALLFLIISFFYHKKILLKKGNKLSNMVRKAKLEFESISNYGRKASEQEIQRYKTKYQHLAVAIQKFRFYKFVTQRLFDSFGIGEYMVFYDTLEQHWEQNNKMFNDIKFLDEWCAKASSELKVLFDDNHYFSHSELKSFEQHNSKEIDKFKIIFESNSKYFTNSKAEILYKFILSMEVYRDNHNKIFENDQLSTHKEYFDNILEYPLDKQQRNAIVCLEDNTLVISSAGSGKTSTIIGKARYLLDIRQIDPSELLIVTYARKAASELYNRLGRGDVECCTFHSLAVKILSEVEDKRPTICPESLLLNIFYDLLRNDAKFLSNTLNYILHLQSLMKLEHEYTHAPNYYSDRKKYGVQAPYYDMNDQIIFTRSEEEKRLCIYLTELGVDFKYEERYLYETHTTDHRQYLPDFTIYVNEEFENPETGLKETKQRFVYLEHFAIDRDSNVPKWFGDRDGGWEYQNRKYNEGIIWKRRTHQKYNTTLIETKSADFHSGRILEVLKDQLSSAGVPYREVPAKELYDRLVRRNRQVERSVFTLLEQIIALAKSNSTSKNPFKPIIDKATENNDTRTLAIINDIVVPLYNAYTIELERLGQIDFTDAINQATDYCAMNKWKRYNYILVDEFQDISVDRYNFLKFLRKNNPLTKIFCVGDDWQSIYRFAGSNMKLFYKFEDFFGFTKNFKIEKTYRFCNPLLRISSEFIQCNPEQIRKEVIPNLTPMPKSKNDYNRSKRNINIDGVDYSYDEDEISLVEEWIKRNHTYLEFVDCGISGFRENNPILEKVKEIIKTIPADESIIILGRYKYDASYIGCVAHNNEEDTYANIDGRKIRFLSVHKSKGLEADNVILINCDEGQNGFPSQIEDDPILCYVLSEEDQFEYAEERRLFYVAITRAKRKTYVLYHGDKPSSFVSELTPIISEQENLCPLCHQGHIAIIKEGVARNGNPYKNYGCSNINAKCDYYERVFGNDIPYFVRFNNERLNRLNSTH